MRGISHRETGVPGAVFDSDITAEIICDGFHINEKIIRMAYKLLGKERMILISDDVACTGMPDGIYEFDGVVNVIKDNTCLLEDGTINGNMKFLSECVKNAVKFGIPFEDAIYCATYNPAKRIGCEDRIGSIKEGKDADIVILDDNMDIQYVIKAGKIIKSK